MAHVELCLNAFSPSPKQRGVPSGVELSLPLFRVLLTLCSLCLLAPEGEVFGRSLKTYGREPTTEV